MTRLEEILRWIRGNEALLSGIAALAAIVGLIVSPIGAALRRRAVRRRNRPSAERSGEPKAAVAFGASTVSCRQRSAVGPLLVFLGL